MSELDVLIEEVLNERNNDFSSLNGINPDELKSYLYSSKFQSILKEKLLNGYELSKDFDGVDNLYNLFIKTTKFVGTGKIAKGIIDKKYYIIMLIRNSNKSIVASYVVINKKGDKSKKELLEFFKSFI